MLEEKEHYKMYKDGKHWVAAKISTVAGVALFSTMVLGGGHVTHVSADTVSTNQVSQVTSSTSSNTKTPVVTGDTSSSQVTAKPAQNSSALNSSSSKATINVDVPHSDLDSAVANAKKDGVQVTQSATQSSSADANHASSAESSIANDYKNQTSAINQADAKQKQINANNSHIGDQGDHSALDSAVSSAKQSGIKVVQDSNQNVGSNQNASQWQNVQNQVNSDYQSQANNIKKTVSDYQNELNQYHQSQQANKDLENKINANNQQIQDLVNQIKAAGGQAIADDVKKYDISNGTSNALADQQAEISSLQDYLNKVKSNTTNSSSGNVEVSTNFKNDFHINAEKADISVKVLNKDSVPSLFVNGTHVEAENCSGPAFQYIVNLAENSSSYKGKAISKIVMTFSDIPNSDYNLEFAPGKLSNDDSGELALYTTVASYYTVSIQMFDSNNNPISFNGNAYLNQDNNFNSGSVKILKGGHWVIKYWGGSKEDKNKNTGELINSDTLVCKSDNNDPNATDYSGLIELSGDTLTMRVDNAEPGKNQGNLNLSLINTSLENILTNTQWINQKPKLQPVHYHLDTISNTTVKAPIVPTVHYHYDTMAMQKEKPVNANYHYDILGVTPVETKSVDADGQSVNGKDVVKNEDITFSLVSAPLPANRTDNIKKLTFTDTLDPNVKLDNWKAVDDQGNDVSKNFTMSQDGRTVTFMATQDYINQINANKGTQLALPTIDLTATVISSGANINNTFNVNINENSWQSNEVSFNTPQSPQPTKTVNSTDGRDINDTFVENGQEIDFNIGLDLSNDKNVILSQNAIKQGLDECDVIDKRLTPNVDGIKISDAKGKDVDKNLFNITNDDNNITIAVKNPQDFLNTYGGQKLNIFIPTKTKQDVSGTITNIATENHFGDKETSNSVSVYIPLPHKDVAAGIVQGVGNVSINGQNVVQGQDLTFELTTSNLPSGRKTNINKFQIVDQLDPNFDYNSYGAFLNGKDITTEFMPSLVKDKDGNWTLILTASEDLIAQMNADKSKDFIEPTIDIYGTARKAGTSIQNRWTEVLNNENWQSNVISVNTEKLGTPIKTVENVSGQNADNGNVACGDSLIYHVSMDLTNQAKDTVLTPETVAKGLWISDKTSNGETVNVNGIRVNSADGKDITDQFTITDENGQVKVSAKDPELIIRNYGGTKLDITIPTTVNDNFVGDIKNTAQQNTFGNITTSNTVVDHVPPMNPTKDVVIDLGNQNSLNGKSIALNSTFDYKLNSSTRPADYVGQTTEWGGKDMIDVKHDEFTGQWQVIADHPFVLKDGTTVKAGSDISKYFTMTFNDKTGEFDIEANKDFLDIMNLPANKKTEQGWSVFLQCKRIAAGTAHNTWTEYYDGRLKNSNTVTTTTPEPKKLETPKTSVPQSQKIVEKAAPVQTAPKAAKAVSPAKEKLAQPVSAKTAPAPAQPVLATPAPVKETPAPEKQVMPQTGESENDEGAIIGLAMLGAVGTMGLALKKKRYEA